MIGLYRSSSGRNCLNLRPLRAVSSELSGLSRLKLGQTQRSADSAPSRHPGADVSAFSPAAPGSGLSDLRHGNVRAATRGLSKRQASKVEVGSRSSSTPALQWTSATSASSADCQASAPSQPPGQATSEWASGPYGPGRAHASRPTHTSAAQCCAALSRPQQTVLDCFLRGHGPGPFAPHAAFGRITCWRLCKTNFEALRHRRWRARARTRTSGGRTPQLPSWLSWGGHGRCREPLRWNIVRTPSETRCTGIRIVTKCRLRRGGAGSLRRQPQSVPVGRI